jgi:hypothetical protein
VVRTPPAWPFFAEPLELNWRRFSLFSYQGETAWLALHGSIEQELHRDVKSIRKDLCGNRADSAVRADTSRVYRGVSRFGAVARRVGDDTNDAAGKAAIVADAGALASDL